MGFNSGFKGLIFGLFDDAKDSRVIKATSNCDLTNNKSEAMWKVAVLRYCKALL